MDADPWNWTVADVQTFFRDQAAEYISDLPHGRLPDLSTFIPALGELGVDGFTLLFDIQLATLRDDCGIKRLNERSAVLRCIGKLRQRSITYLNQQKIELHSLQALSAVDASVPGSMVSPLRVPVITPPAEPSVALVATSGAEQSFAPAANPTAEPSAAPIAGEHRQGEKLFEDGRGRKRRKLDLSSSNAPSSIIPKNCHLSDAAFSIEKIFFGQTAYGHQIKEPASQDGILQLNDEFDSSKDHFQVVPQLMHVGAHHMAYKRMRHFLNNPTTVILQRGGRPAIAVLPYRGDDEQDTIRSALVVQYQGIADQPIATKEHAANLHREDAETEAGIDDESAAGVGEWDFLVDKYKSGELLDVYGKASGDGDQYSITASEDESKGSLSAEAEEVSESVDGDLSSEEANVIVETFIKEQVTQWQGRLPAREKAKAWTVWSKMKKSRTLRTMLIQTAQARIAHLTGRLAKAKRDILANQWSDNNVLRQACRNLDAIIDDREDERWKISIWQRRQEPFHQIRRGQHKGCQAAAGPAKSAPAFIPDAADRMDFIPAVQDANEEITYEADDELPAPHVDPGPSESPALLSQDYLDDFIANGSESNYEVQAPDILIGSDPKDGNYSPGSPSGSEEDLASPSGFVKPRSTVKSSTTPSKNPHGFDFDLTNLSSSTPASSKKRGRLLKSSSTTPQTPSIKRGRPKAQSPKYEGDPLQATASQIANWEIADLIARKDRTRLLILLLRDVDAQIRSKILALQVKLKKQFPAELVTACEALGPAKGTPSPILDPNEVQSMEHARDLYVHWFFASPANQQTASLSKGDLQSVADVVQAQNFNQILNRILQTKSMLSEFKPKIGSSSAPMIISSSGDEVAPQSIPPKLTPRKVRKRTVAVDKTAQQARTSAAERQKRYEESQGATDPAQLEAMIGGFSGLSIEINPVRDADCDAIYVPEPIARRMKAHQIDGVRFLWREITANAEEGEQGCILAHTMGLGKTMQTIALLATLDQVAHSNNRRQRSQLPDKLCPDDIIERSLRVLVLCPPSLLPNWRREIDQWAQKMLGDVLTLESANKAFHLDNLEAWTKFGGVLLVGYQMFRNLVSPTERAKPKTIVKQPAAKRIQELLLNGPEIVVADEAHNLKNDQSGVAKACDQIKTESRIGLTGTPMSNDVQEIYALVSWVAPGFLGHPVEFRAHYAEPIQNGLYNDSTASEKRRSIMKLKVLHAEIQPKVNRANIEVLRGSLKPKIEFVITVPLGAVQTQLYQKTVTALLSGERSENASQVAIFGWLSVLTLLTNHPHCFRERLKTPPPPKQAKKKIKKVARVKINDDAGSGSNEDRSPEESEAGSIAPTVAATVVDGEDVDPFEKPVRALGFTEDMINKLINEFDGSMDAALSAKMAIFLELLAHCLRCKDKVLVFSSSLLTLDFLGQLLHSNNHRFGRIDGTTPMANRTPTLESFHNDRFNIMLVSTRAGGVGLNIQGANRVFIFDFGFNPTHEEQAIGRAYRLGQTKPVFVYRFVAGGTFETNIYNRQLFKTGLAQRVVDKKTPRRIAEKKTRDYLYPPTEVSQEDLQEWIGKDPEVLDKLLAKHGEGPGKKDSMIRAIKTMETLQEDAMDAPLDAEEQTLVNQEIELGRKRPKGRKGATYVPQYGGPGAAPAATQIVRLPVPSMARPAQLPPPSTFAGTTYQQYSIGGLPLSKE